MRQPNADPGAMVNAPFTDFLPADGGFAYSPGNLFAQFDSAHSYADGLFHDITMNWRNDGSNYIEYLIDGKLFMRTYVEYYQDSYTDPITGAVKQIGMHLLIGGQAIPGFILGGATSVAIPDRDALSMTVASIDIWQGNLVQSSIVKPTNALSPYPTVTLATPAATHGSAWSSALTGLVTTNTKTTAVSSDGTALTVSGSTISGTFVTVGTKMLTITTRPAYPASAGGTAIGVPTTSTVLVTVS